MTTFHKPSTHSKKGDFPWLGCYVANNNSSLFSRRKYHVCRNMSKYLCVIRDVLLWKYCFYFGFCPPPPSFGRNPREQQHFFQENVPKSQMRRTSQTFWTLEVVLVPASGEESSKQHLTTWAQMCWLQACGKKLAQVKTISNGTSIQTLPLTKSIIKGIERIQLIDWLVVVMGAKVSWCQLCSPCCRLLIGIYASPSHSDCDNRAISVQFPLQRPIFCRLF